MTENAQKHRLERLVGESRHDDLYQRRTNVCCCILAGDIDSGGLATLIPVLGFTIGIAFLVRIADGWWILS